MLRRGVGWLVAPSHLHIIPERLRDITHKRHHSKLYFDNRVFSLTEKAKRKQHTMQLANLFLLKSEISPRK